MLVRNNFMLGLGASFYMVHTGLTTFYSRTFPGLFNNMQGVRFHRHTITYFPQSLQKKNHSFSFSSMELNFVSKEARPLSLSFSDCLKAFA